MNKQLMKIFKDNKDISNKITNLKTVKNEDSDEATLYVYDVIVSDDYWGGVSAINFIKELSSIEASTIHLRINSPGGDAFAGRAIQQAISEHKSKIISHIDGYAASAASYIALAADEVHMGEGSFFMIHKASTIEWGNADDMLATANFLNKIDESLAKTYADKTKLTEEEALEMMAEETWISSDEAVELGFADKITTQSPENKVKWDISAYSNAPTEEKPKDLSESDKLKLAEAAKIIEDKAAEEALLAEEAALQEEEDQRFRELNLVLVTQ